MSERIHKVSDEHMRLSEKVEALAVEMYRQGMELRSIEYRRAMQPTLTVETVCGDVTVVSRDLIESILRQLGR